MNPQQNREQQASQIKKNQLQTIQNKKGYIVAIVLALVLFITTIAYFEYRTYDLHKCEQVLYEYLTDKKEPAGLHLK